MRTGSIRASMQVTMASPRRGGVGMPKAPVFPARRISCSTMSIGEG